jgi:BioD-like phosphotransacetylase family protein
MADKEVSSECSSHNAVENKGNDEVTSCKRCKEYEEQLKEAQDELTSAQMINKLLQKELLSYNPKECASYRTIEPRNLIQCSYVNANKAKEDRVNHTVIGHLIVIGQWRYIIL